MDKIQYIDREANRFVTIEIDPKISHVVAQDLARQGHHVKVFHLGVLEARYGNR